LANFWQGVNERGAVSDAKHARPVTGARQLKFQQMQAAGLRPG
jgi:hypothetical protein